MINTTCVIGNWVHSNSHVFNVRIHQLINNVAGSQIRSLYSISYIDKIVAHTELSYITTKGVAQRIRHHLSSRHCDVFVYISLEKELIILIVPTNGLPTQSEVTPIWLWPYTIKVWPCMFCTLYCVYLQNISIY